MSWDPIAERRDQDAAALARVRGQAQETLTDRLVAAQKAQRRRARKSENAKRRRQLTAARGQISKSKRRRVYKRDGYRCVKCGATEDLSLDHIIPVSRGGTNAYDNLQTMCSPCNCRKGHRMPKGVTSRAA